MKKIEYRKFVTEQVAAQIRTGSAPWQRPCQEGNPLEIPFDPVTGRKMRGANALFLLIQGQDDPRWCRFDQAMKQNWKIKRGSKATTIEYYKKNDRGYEVSYVNIFNANQIENMPQSIALDMQAEATIQVQSIIENCPAEIVHGDNDKMAYFPIPDRLLLPLPESFPTMKHYHAALLRGIVIRAAYLEHKDKPAVISETYRKEKQRFRIQLAEWSLVRQFGLPFEPKQEDNERLAQMLEQNQNEFFFAARDAEKITLQVMCIEREKAPIKEAEEEKLMEVKGPPYSWARYCANGYELSSAGDSRFSALNARLKDGRTIEEAYQLDVKGYRQRGNDWHLGKGKPPLREISREALYQEYRGLWRQWALENPALFQELREKAKGKTLTDRFAASDISQARALADLLQNGLTRPALTAPMPAPVSMQDLFQSAEVVPVQPEADVVQSKERENITEERNHERIQRNDAGRMDSVTDRQQGSDRGVQSGSESIQPEQIPADGKPRGHKQPDRMDLKGERSAVQGENHDDTSRVPDGGNGLSRSVPREDKDRTADAGRSERGIDEDPKRVSAHSTALNFKIREGKVPSGPKTRYRHNVEAICLLKKIEAEGRRATAKEQEVLAGYSGWGGITEAFVYGNGEVLQEERTQGWEAESEELKKLLDKKEYADARKSILDAYYTPPEVVEAIWKIAARLGFKHGRVLEPSMGTGRFFGKMPEGMIKGSQLYGAELDSISGRIAKQLYQEAHIVVDGFEKFHAPDSYFDLAISNVPFGDYKISDPEYNKHNYKIHNYFLAKAMDKVRSGGLVMMITSTGTLESGGDARTLRENLDGKADLIGAVRLPDTVFKAAGTQVTTDILIFQKRVKENVPSPYAQKWLRHAPSGLKARQDEADLTINEYYIQHPTHLLGELAEDTLYGGGRLALKGNDVQLNARLEKVIENFPEGIYHALKSAEAGEERTFLAPAEVRERAFFQQFDKAYQCQSGSAVEIGEADQDKILQFIQIKETLKELLAAQLNPDLTNATLSKWQQRLNTQYDAFVQRHGHLNADKNLRKLSVDPEFGMVAAIEDYRIDKKTKEVTCQKRDIFIKRTIQAVNKIQQAESASDALIASFNERGRVDMTYMCCLLEKEEKEVAAALKGILYENPQTKNWETSDEYLSGNVREKLAQAKAAAEEDKRYEENVQALEKVQPGWLEAEEISVGLGVPWIPEKDIEKFAGQLTGEGQGFRVDYNSYLNEWNVSPAPYSSIKGSVANRQTWGTDRRDFISLLSDALNQRTPTVYKPDPLDDTKRIVDHQATALANAKLEKIKREFENWIWKDNERRNRLVSYYNENFNNWRLREYDGSHLTLQGYSLLAPPLKKHQKDTIWRIMQSGNTLVGHCVGAGKTWTMQAASMEMRRLGLRQKPMHIIPSSLVQQYEKEFRIIYPAAKILMVTSDDLPEVNIKVRKGMSKEEIELKRNMKNAKRQELLARIAMEDWDAIIISHDLFKRIPLSPEYYNEFYQKQIEVLTKAIWEASDSSHNTQRFKKNLEAAKQRLQQKLITNVNELKKDIVLPFEQLGIDQIFVDEADLFKNLYFPTKMDRIAGLSNSDAQRSMDMFIKAQYLNQCNKGCGKEGGVVFATGTPMSNTIAEMFTMKRYLDLLNLERHNMEFFDNWASQFAKIGVAIERSPDGNGYRKVTKILSFVNAPELIRMFRKFADIKQAQDLDLKRPALKNGKRTVVTVEPSADLKQYIKYEILARAKAIREGCDPREDNMLKLTSDLRKASLDMRLIDPSIPADEANGKLQALVENVLEVYKKSEADKGTQMIFCDLSTPKGVSDKVEDKKQDAEEETEEKKIVIYDEIKKMLLRKGIPSQEIAFIHDAKTKEQKLKIIEAVNDGKIRVLLGSTGKLGAGVNAQKRLAALHHLDCPWVRLEVA